MGWAKTGGVQGGGGGGFFKGTVNVFSLKGL